MRNVYEDISSGDEVMAILDRNRPSDAGHHSQDVGSSDHWDLGIGFNGAMDAYTGGWAEGAQKAYELAEKLRPRPMGSRTALRRSVAGSFPNVGAHLAGAPNAMWRVTKKHSTGKPYVHLFMHIGYSAGTNATTAFNRGCALVAVADALESAGCRVKITLVDGGKSMRGGVRHVRRTVVKEYGDRLDVDQLIFTAAHPAYMRRIGFALTERHPDKGVRAMTADGSYGMPLDMAEADCPEDGSAVNVLFPSLGHQTGEPEDFLRRMVAALPDEVRTEIEAAE